MWSLATTRALRVPYDDPVARNVPGPHFAKAPVKLRLLDYGGRCLL